MPRSSDPVMIPDPWSDNALRDASRFAPSPCGFVELWQRENGDVSVHTGALPPAGIKEWVREQVYSAPICGAQMLTSEFLAGKQRPAFIRHHGRTPPAVR